MNQSDFLRAIRKRTPDSIAPDGEPLKWVTRSIHELSENEKDVIIERRFGWEKADCATLARVFCAHPTTIAMVCELHPRKQRGS